MTRFVPSSNRIDSDVLRLLESISHKQGELSAHRRVIQNEETLNTAAIVDAVHFSTRIEGNALSREQVTQALAGRMKAPAHDLREVLNYYQALRTLQTKNFYDIPSGQDIRSWIAYWLHCLLSAYDEALTRIGGSVSAISSLSQTPALDDRLQRARNIFQRYRRLRASEYAELTRLGRTQSVSDLNALVKTGGLDRIGGGRSTVYQIKTTGH